MLSRISKRFRNGRKVQFFPNFAIHFFVRRICIKLYEFELSFAHSSLIITTIFLKKKMPGGKACA